MPVEIFTYLLYYIPPVLYLPEMFWVESTPKLNGFFIPPVHHPTTLHENFSHNPADKETDGQVLTPQQRLVFLSIFYK